MLRNYLQEIKKNIVFLFSAKKIWDKVINTVIFWNIVPENLYSHKKEFLSNMRNKKFNLMKIREDLYKNETNFLYRDVLEIELDYQIEVINFLSSIYDIEAQKIDPNYNIEDDIDSIDYDHFNNVFWWLDKSYLKQKFELSQKKSINFYLTKNEVIYLLESAKILIPEIKYSFWDYPNLAFNGWLLKIHNSNKFHIKDVVSLIFHEITHFFRYENWKRNLGFSYSFSDYPTLEEWIAIYNEFKYGNNLIEYWWKDPIYDMCLQYLLEDTSEDEKISKISKILRLKWFWKDKIYDYYNRFYRFVKIWAKDLYLKDLIYTKGYNNVVKLIEEDPNNYERIIAGRVWTSTIRKWIIKPDNNLDSTKFFEEMEEIVRKLFKVKGFI